MNLSKKEMAEVADLVKHFPLMALENGDGLTIKVSGIVRGPQVSDIINKMNITHTSDNQTKLDPNLKDGYSFKYDRPHLVNHLRRVKKIIKESKTPEEAFKKIEEYQKWIEEKLTTHPHLAVK
jgi:hypothetical protein